MTRLLIVTTVARTQEAFLLPFARHFREQGWQVNGLAEGISTSQDSLEAFDNVHEVKWSRNPANPANLLLAPRQILRAVREGKYDLIHVHTPVAAFVTRAVARFHRRSRATPRIIYTAHGFHFNEGDQSLRNQVFLTLEKAAAHWTDYLVILNAEDQRLALKHALVPPDRLVWMPGIGVNTTSIAPESVSDVQIRDVRSRLGISDHDVLLSMFAAFEPRKRHSDALRALAATGTPHVHLALAGSGPLMPEMQRLAGELGIAERVHFLGHCPEVKSLMRASVATLLPSLREGLSRSVLESLSLAVPVIGTDVKGISDVVGQGCGIVVRVGDIQGLARAIRRFADYPDEARDMGDVGRKLMQTGYDTAHIIELHEQLYARALLGEDEASAIRTVAK